MYQADVHTQIQVAKNPPALNVLIPPTYFPAQILKQLIIVVFCNTLLLLLSSTLFPCFECNTSCRKKPGPLKNNLQFSTLFDESSPPQTQIQCKQYKNSKYYYILLLLLLEQLFVWHYILHGVLHIIHRQ
jgi:hypothetical protein